METRPSLLISSETFFADSKSIQAEVGQSLANLITVTQEKIVQKNAHLGMFFDMDWNLLADEISYGHDIEASWLLWEAACELKDEELKEQIRADVIKMAEVALDEGFDKENGCLENFLLHSTTNPKRDRTRVWWNQAEAMNGFYNAWQMTGETKYQEACIKQWNWIQNYQVDKTNGEWWSALDQNGTPILAEDKGGNWKTSYHNGRTCLELLRRSQE